MRAYTLLIGEIISSLRYSYLKFLLNKTENLKGIGFL